jgi:hypothetical protein
VQGTTYGSTDHGGLIVEQRKAIGWTLVGVGALTTIPLAVEVFSKRQ